MEPSHLTVSRRPVAATCRGAFPSNGAIPACALLFAAAVATTAFFSGNTSLGSVSIAASVRQMRTTMLNISMRLEASMIDAYDRAFHEAGDRPVIVDIFPGIHDDRDSQAIARTHPEQL